ncbi:DNA-binding transcriptional regulator IdnR [Acerihabitans arboris]|uniref:LacI family DNA-binding transcriptional regulator n=1 Tax=Acerihabitans arboris TaxID=2691583 RepID=A0A845SSZ5_9GAMM|nr:substrate-binding domain-containing protein [Acerihabitans arboris]NDL65848.1 LacI family DNA-binding transcriptional regulator [Acerihabitans arboris]
MKGTRITLQDIATLAGVTKMTVSRYLRDPNQVSEKSRQLISKALEGINYIPNRAPEILLNSHSKCIGILIPSFKNQIFSDVLAGIESVTSAHSYQTIIANYDYESKIEEEKIINLLSYNIDAIILTGKEHTERTRQFLRMANIPIAEIMDITEEYLDIQVGFDNEKAAYDMAQAILESGKKNIVYVGSMADPRDASRYRGVCQALEQVGKTPLQLLPKSISSIALGSQLFIRAQREFPGVDALFCTNDDLAVGALLECQSQGIRVPEQMAIVGFHGLDIGRANVQKLASVITPRFDIGKTTAELLLKRLAGKSVVRNVDLNYQIYFGQTL